MSVWREAARAAGLSDLRESPVELTGSAGRGLLVRLSRYRDEESTGTQITISGAALPGDMTVRREQPGFLGRKGGRDLETGDEAFDDVAWIRGPAAIALALLDFQTRRAIRSLLAGYVEIKERPALCAAGVLERGVLRVEVPEAVVPSDSRSGPRRWDPADGLYLGWPERFPEVLCAALALARRLDATADTAPRLASNLISEPLAGVRLRLLTTLIREFPEHPATREALLTARADPDADVRLRAGIALGKDGREVLFELVQGEGAPDETNAHAVAALAEQLSVAQVESVLRNGLRLRKTKTARACLTVLGRRGGPEAVEMLARVLKVERGELACAAADALGDTSDATAEQALLEALSGAAHERRLAAARALGRTGTAAAILPLREAEKDDAALRRVARQAAAESQSRLPGASPGQLSLAENESGRLSLSEGDEQGRLSLAGSEAEVARRSRPT